MPFSDTLAIQIYNAIEAGAKVKVNKFIKAGTLMKNYAFILVSVADPTYCYVKVYKACSGHDTSLPTSL